MGWPQPPLSDILQLELRLGLNWILNYYEPAKGVHCNVVRLLVYDMVSVLIGPK